MVGGVDNNKLNFGQIILDGPAPINPILIDFDHMFLHNLFLEFQAGLPSSILVGRIGITMSTSPVAFELVDGVNVTTLFRGKL